LQLFPETTATTVKAIFINFGENETKYCLQKATELRKSGIPVEIYPDAVKIKKQMSYADTRKIPYVIFTGENEIKNNTMTIKKMADGSQETLSAVEVIGKLI